MSTVMVVNIDNEMYTAQKNRGSTKIAHPRSE